METNNIITFLKSSQLKKALAFIAFTIVLTAVTASQNFFFQNIIENGISKRDIIAQKTLSVEDVKKTEQHRKEAMQKIDPILVPAEDEFIETNLQTLRTSIMQIRKKDTVDSVKKEELGILFDIPENSRKDFVINVLLRTDDNSLNEIFDKASLTLSNILHKGITEKDYENGDIDKIIISNLVSNVSKRQISVIRALLEQVIVPNLVEDEFATENARRTAQNSVKPYIITFQKGDKIVFEGEPVTRLKRDALRQAGFNVYELNWQGLAAMYVLVFIGTLLFLLYMKFFEKQFLEKNYLTISAVLTLILVLISVLLPTGFSPYILPVPAFIFILSIFTSPRVAFVASTLLLTVLSIGHQYNLQFFAAFILLNLVATIAISQIRFSKRMDLIKTGFEISLAGVVIVFSIYLLEKCLIDVSNMLILTNTGLVLLNGVLSAIIALGTLPLFESATQIITPYGLAELADHNQPLLKRLQFEAPGTYHHSLMVSNLCEAAAEAIGANPILVLVGALYDDIWKLIGPLFFV